MAKKKAVPGVIVYVLMYYSASGSGARSLCAIFSTREKAVKYAKKLKKKMIQPDDSYSVDAWHVDGAEGL